jgi:hypothetical protein
MNQNEILESYGLKAGQFVINKKDNKKVCIIGATADKLICIMDEVYGQEDLNIKDIDTNLGN